MTTREKRKFRVELRNEGDTPTIVGLAARFNSWSVDLGGFREIIRPGAFADALEISDIRALWNHNDDLVLGRLRSNTLEAAENEDGLAIRIQVPETQAGRDAVISISRGDVDQMSFAFTIPQEGGDRWWQEEDGVVRREIIKFERLYDVSPVTYPAYEETAVSVRQIVEGRSLTDAERKALQHILEPNLDPKGDGTSPADPALAGRHAADQGHDAGDPVQAGRRLNAMQRRIELIERF